MESKLKGNRIYIYDSRELIQQGIDEEERKYYEIYYKEEL